jgi:ribosome-binding factor A
MPQGSRPARVGDLIREELSVLLQREVRNPDLQRVTLTHVRMSKDLQHAHVLYTATADQEGRRALVRAFRKTGPYLKRLLGRRLRLRYVPELSFEYDESVERQDRVAQLFAEIAATRPPDDGHDG